MRYIVSIQYIGKLLLITLLLAIVALGVGIFIAWGKLMAAGILIFIPVSFALLYLIFVKPRMGIFLALLVSFFSIGITRYISAPLGLSLDFALLLTLVAAIFNCSKKDYGRLNNVLVVLTFIWFLFTVLELFNPEAVSRLAWFYAVRSVSLYMLFVIPLVFLVFYREKDLDQFIFVWLLGSVISALYGAKQLHIGLDAVETAWLAAGAAETHLLFGKLRVFSFYSDAGQFGAFMAFSTVVGAIVGLKTNTLLKKLYYFGAALICFYGMAISGTRGAMFVFSGIFFYLLLSKNFKVLILGLVFLGSCFYLLKYTYVGQGVYEIQRMRSALDPEDPSFQVRLENQRKFREYLATRPIGGGIGTAGYWGERFSPGTFLAKTPTDSWYVRIWAEMGIVGLSLYILFILAVLAIAYVKINNIRDVYLKQKLIALYSGVFGIAVASYGNQVIGQMPTIVCFYISLAFLFLGPAMDEEKNTSLRQ
ncbi:MAG TPA: O-antigen ligase family protein [Cytophagaceae bacterium]